MQKDSVYTDKILDEKARRLFANERRIKRLDGWFLIREISEEYESAHPFIPAALRKARALLRVCERIPLSLDENAVFAGTQRDAFAKSYALINPNFKVSTFNGYCDPAAVFRDIEPNEEGKGYEFENKIVGGVVPKEYIPAIDKGIQEALNSGVLAGYPVEDVKVELVDGSYHDVDSSEAAFKVAGSMAIKDALKKSDPVILEPVMAVEVETPEEYTGFVMGDIPSRRGLIQGQEQRGNAVCISAKVPLGQMFGYATDLRSGTQGRATYTMQFDSYEPVPKNVAEEIISKAGGNA